MFNHDLFDQLGQAMYKLMTQLGNGEGYYKENELLRWFPVLPMLQLSGLQLWILGKTDLIYQEETNK